MKTYDLMFGCLGNGITVCDRSQIVNGDYKTVAHIAEWGGIKLYDKQLESDPAAMERINDFARRNRDKFWEWWRKQSRATQLNLYYGCLTISQLTSGKALVLAHVGKLYQEYIRLSCLNGRYVMPLAAKEVI